MSRLVARGVRAKLPAGGVITTTWDTATAGAALAFTNGNRTVEATLSNNASYARSTTSRSVAGGGKYYFEWTEDVVTGTPDYHGIGFAGDLYVLGTDYVGSPGSDSIGAYDSGIVYFNNASVKTLGAFTAATIGRGWIDLANMRAWFARGSGNPNNDVSADPTANIGGIDISTLVGSSIYVAMGLNWIGQKITGNFGNAAFGHSTFMAGYTAFGQ